MKSSLQRNQRFFASIHIYIGLALTLFVFACGNNGESQKRNYLTTDYSSISKDSATKIWQQLFQRNPSFIAVSSYTDGEPLIFGVNHSDWRRENRYEIYMLEYFAGLWQVRDEQKYGSEFVDSYLPDTFELVQTDELFGLYFLEENHPMGTAFNNLTDSRDYHFIQIPQFKCWRLSYSKWMDSPGEFHIDSALRENSRVLDFLEKKALNDTLKEVINPAEYILSESKNAEFKWKIDNPRLSSSVGPPDSWSSGQLVFTHYSENIVTNFDIEQTIRNERYQIWSSSWGDVIAYDLKTKQFFPIYYGSCMRVCGKQLRWFSKDEVDILWVDLLKESPNVIRVNLETGYFEPLKTREPFNTRYRW
jgi:hypothetical protein